MTAFEFGLTMLVIGMGGTLGALFLITVGIRLLTAFFPQRNTPEEKK
ncbi:MAG: OadG-related small transporter subunit [Terrimicrobiaceae bacterium]|nr:OadG-related small transporter subunit [Terrimicrobiaceae bacterium]